MFYRYLTLDDTDETIREWGKNIVEDICSPLKGTRVSRVDLDNLKQDITDRIKLLGKARTAELCSIDFTNDGPGWTNVSMSIIISPKAE